MIFVMKTTMKCAVVVSLTAACCMLANSGCTTSIPNDSTVATFEPPLVVLDSAKDPRRAAAAAQDEIELDYDSKMQIALELVNGLQEPISVRCTESADHSILNLEVELYRNGKRLLPRLISKPPHIDLFKPRRLAHNESVMSTIRLTPEYKDDDLTTGEYEVVFRYQASPGNAIGLTPLNLEKRVKLRISRSGGPARAALSGTSRRN
jgi:hypothetical protein